MGWSKHLEPDPREALIEYVKILLGGLDPHPLAVKIDDDDEHG